jgi:hypothetical protein
MQDLRDTRIAPLITKFYRGLSANLPPHPLPLCSIPRQGRWRSKRAKLSAAHAFSSSATVGKRKRESRGPSFGSHRRRRGAGAAGIGAATATVVWPPAQSGGGGFCTGAGRWRRGRARAAHAAGAAAPFIGAREAAPSWHAMAMSAEPRWASRGPAVGPGSRMRAGVG